MNEGKKRKEKNPSNAKAITHQLPPGDWCPASSWEMNTL